MKETNWITNTEPFHFYIQQKSSFWVSQSHETAFFAVWEEEKTLCAYADINNSGITKMRYITVNVSFMKAIKLKYSIGID